MPCFDHGCTGQANKAAQVASASSLRAEQRGNAVLLARDFAHFGLLQRGWS